MFFEFGHALPPFVASKEEDLNAWQRGICK